MATISRKGFGQVEPNHLSAQRTSQVYAQLPAKSTMTVLENGQFVKYDYANNEVNLTGNGEYMLVFNEVKLYEDAWRETYKDYAMKAADFTDGKMYPRVLKTNIGDIYTTNCVGGAVASKDGSYTGIALVEKDLLKVDTATGYLVKTAALADADMIWQVAKVYTMADGQPAVKIQRVK